MFWNACVRPILLAASFLFGLSATLPVATGTPITLASLNPVGTSQLLLGGVLRLTPNFDPDLNGPTPAGAAWTASRYNVADPFQVNFRFRMSDPTGHLDNDGSGGDGIAFVIQNSAAGSSAVGEGAGGMGFLGIFNSVAVMLDTYQNNFYYGDPNGNYIGVNTRGTDFNVPHHYCTNGELTSDPSQGTDLPGVPCTANPTIAITGLLPTVLDDGVVHNLTLLYVPGTLAIALDFTPVLTVPINFANTLDLDGGTGAFLGFTAGTRASYQNQDILEFSFETSELPTWVQGLVGTILVIGAVVLKCRWQTD